MKHISTTLTADRPRANSTGPDNWRLSVEQKVHFGPAPTVGRSVTLVMDRDETMRLVRDLLGSLPVLFLCEQRNAETIRSFARMVEVANREPDNANG